MKSPILALVSIIVFAALACQVLAVDASPKWKNALKPKPQDSKSFTLANKGVAEFDILVPANPTTMERKAAEDLAKWLKEITGGTFNVISEGSGYIPTSEVISLGDTRLYDYSRVTKPELDLGREGYSITVDGSRIFMIGGPTRGIINAVYSFLEEDLGCRWYAAGTQTIPKSPTLKVRLSSRSFRPVLEDRRSPYFSDAFEASWSLQNNTYCTNAAVPLEWGGYPSVWGFVHTYDRLVPPAQYFEQHPEYFSEIGGKRQPFQLCMTNPDVLGIVIEQVHSALKENPNLEFIEVSPNDRRDYCECSECKKIDDAEGTKMGSLLQFINKVADSIKDQYPNAKINTLAYLDTVTPPKTIYPRKNVSFWLCTDAYAWSHPNDYAWETPVFAEAMERWGKMDANMIIWDYPSSFAYMTPNINIPVMSENLNYYIKNGATGVMFQCTHDTNFGADHSFMRSWVWAKQLWNPALDTRALIRDFNYGYYGVAAEYMQRYDDMLWDAWVTYRKHRKDTKPFDPVDKQFVDKAWVLMKQAEEIAKSDPELLKRVKTAQMPIMFMKATYGVGNDPAGYSAMLDDFEATAKAANAVYIENAFQGPDRDKQFAYWRKIAATDPEKISLFDLPQEWSFAPDAQVVGLTETWYATEFNDAGWAKVRSDKKSGWESQGFKDYHGYGWYRQTIDIPESVLNNPGLEMIFLAVDEQAEVFINGQRAFDHTVASTGLPVETLWTTPFMFDPKPFLKPGKNVIAVRVHDTLGQAGIWKPVYLAWGEGLDPTTIETIIKTKTGK